MNSPRDFREGTGAERQKPKHFVVMAPCRFTLSRLRGRNIPVKLSAKTRFTRTILLIITKDRQFLFLTVLAVRFIFSVVHADFGLFVCKVSSFSFINTQLFK